MIISSLYNNSDLNVEDRKLKSQRRIVADAYKRSSTFVDASKNPTIKMIEDLLQSDTPQQKKLLGLTRNANAQLETKLAELETASAREFQNEDNEFNNFYDYEWNGLWFNSEFEPSELDVRSQNESGLDVSAMNEFAFLAPERMITRTFNQHEFFNVDKSFFNITFQKAISSYKKQMNMVETGFIGVQSRYSITA